jgi:hypothetical protein
MPARRLPTTTTKARLRPAHRAVGHWLIRSLRRIAALEYALVDACEGAARGAGAALTSLFATRAGTAQVHLFDLGTALRELGDPAPSYSYCVRHALLHNCTPDEVLRSLERESENLLRRQEVPGGLRTLLRANLAEHRSLVSSYVPVALLA